MSIQLGSLPTRDRSVLRLKQRQDAMILFGELNAKIVFGAKGNGIDDDTAALQRAINEAALTSSTLYIPPGTYNFTKLYLQHHATENPDFPSGITRRGRFGIRGSGGVNEQQNLTSVSMVGTVLNCTSTTGIPIVANVETEDPQQFPHRATKISDLTIVGNSADWVMQVDGGSQWVYQRLRILQKNVDGSGLRLIDPDQVVMDNITIVGTEPRGAGTVGFQFENVDIDSSGSNLENFIVRSFETAYEVGAPASTGNFIRATRFALLRCRDNDVGIVVRDRLEANTFEVCQFRGADYAARLFGRQKATSFLGCVFSPFGSPTALVEIGDPTASAGDNDIDNLLFEGCLFQSIDPLGVQWHGGSGTPFSNISQVRFEGNRFFVSSGATAVNFDGVPDGGTFVHNEIGGAGAPYSGSDHTAGLDEWTDYSVDPDRLTRRELAVAGGSTLNGQLTIQGQFTPMELDHTAGADTKVNYLVGGTRRWRVGRTSDAETGSNAGSNFDFIRYDDSGTNIGTPLTIERATGAATFEHSVNIGVFTDATRPAAGIAGRVIYNSTDTNLNIDTGSGWILPDGTAT